MTTEEVRAAAREMGLGRKEARSAFASWYVLLGYLLFAFALFANNLENAFVYDDIDTIVNNGATHGVGKAGQIFTTASWWPPESIARHYRPLTTFSYAVNYSIGGLNPFGYHLVNNLLHGLASWLVFLVLSEIGAGSVVAMAIGALFLAHPVHVESVSWINGRADILAGLFIIAALLCHIRSCHNGTRAHKLWKFAALISCLCAGLSKETGFMAPVVVLAWDLFFRDRNQSSSWDCLRGGWGGYLPYAILFAAFLAIRSHFAGGAAEATVTRMASPLVDATVVDRVLTGCYVIARYLWLLICPLKLCVDYSPNEITKVSSLADFRAWVGLFAVLSYLMLTILTSKRFGHVGFALLMSALVFAPASNILFPVGTIMAERLMYLPALSVCVLLAVISWNWKKSEVIFFGGLISLIVIAYGARTFVRNLDWKDEVSLFSSALTVSPRSAMVNKNLGGALLTASRPQEAIPYYEIAIRILPQFPNAHSELGSCYFRLGQYDKAMRHYQDAIALVPGHVTAHVNLGAAYHALSRYEDALKEFDAAIKLSPNSSLAYFNRVHTLIALDRIDDAERALDEAIQRFPNNPSESLAREKLEARAR